MSANGAQFDAKNYMNIQGLANLKGQSKSNSKMVREEVAQQFESLLVQMLLKSMRDANKALINGEEMDSSGEMYQDLFDKQVALSMSSGGIGLGKTIEDYLQRVTSASVLPKEAKPVQETPTPNQSPLQVSNQISDDNASSSVEFETESDFVKNLWSHAKKAASALGLDPKLLVAQAVLETGWGKRIIANKTTGSSHNLFNIKADKSWEKKMIVANTVEYQDGMMQREKTPFRAYTSYAESFNDYVHLIKNDSRYQDALKEHNNPEAYVRLLQKANFATDSNYSEKIMSIYRGDRFNKIIKKAELV